LRESGGGGCGVSGSPRTQRVPIQAVEGRVGPRDGLGSTWPLR